MHLPGLIQIWALLGPESTSSHIPMIEQTLNVFSHAVDTQNFGLLNLHFTSDAYCNFNDDKGILHGIENITANLADGLIGVKTHHALSTQLIKLTTSMTATSVSYLQGSFFHGDGLAVDISTTYGQ